MEIKIPQGYQQTEIGTIPNDWNVKDLKTISEVVRGGSPRPAGHPRFFGGSYIPWLTVASLTNIPGSCLYVSQTIGCLTEEGSKYSRTLDEGTLIIANSGATLGVAKILAIRCCANDGIAALINLEKSVDKLFLCYFLNTKTRQFREVIATGNGQPNLNTTLIGLTKVPIPPIIEEQKAIAQALSDADAAIAKLDRLITKKRHIKQGAMQQLLTGKKRLPGFSGEWEVKKLGDIGYFYSGGTPNTCNPSFYGGHIPWITSGDLNSRRVRSVDGRITQKGLENSSAKLVTPNTLLIALYGATAGITAISEINAAINQAVLAIILKNDCTEFFFYKLTSIKDWIIKTYTQGGQPNLSGNIVKCITLGIPTIEEQKAIAQVLSDMDTEIEALEQKRDKYKAIKQGMMQELLTGKTRLVNNE